MNMNTFDYVNHWSIFSFHYINVVISSKEALEEKSANLAPSIVSTQLKFPPFEL